MIKATSNIYLNYIIKIWKEFIQQRTSVRM